MASTNRIMKARVATVQVGALSIEGLMLEDGSFAVAVPQIAEIALNGTTQNQASKVLKRICSKHSKTSINWVPVKTEFNKNRTLCVSLSDFQRVIRAADRAGHDAAADLVDDLMGLSLQQLFCDAFGVKFEAEHRQRFLTALQRSRDTRRQYTDVIKEALEKQGIYGTPMAAETFKRLTVQANQHLFGQKHFKCDRNNMTEDQLIAIERFEGWVGQLANGYPSWSIEAVVKEALERTPSAA